MAPFNIKIAVQTEEITLTILPTDQDYFKIVYYGRVLGAIHYDKTDDRWNLVKPEEVIAGDLPPYAGIVEEGMVEINLDSSTIVIIGTEILKSHAF
jgi:predicted RNA-binding protein with PUA domain